MNILNIQAVIPLAKGKLITRTIFPIVRIPDFASESGKYSSGLSDIVATAFFVPESKKVIWGFGPVLELPTGGSKRGTQKWSVVPSFLALIQLLDGASMAYTSDQPDSKTKKTTQHFEVFGSRGFYHDGWFAATFGPKAPWELSDFQRLLNWEPENDVWELYNLEEDYSQFKDLGSPVSFDYFERAPFRFNGKINKT